MVRAAVRPSFLRKVRATSVKKEACFRFYRISRIVLCKSGQTKKEGDKRIPPHNISNVHTTRRYHANVFGMYLQRQNGEIISGGDAQRFSLFKEFA